MTNIRLSGVDQYEDVASKHAYRTFFRHEPEKKRLRRIHMASRDSARTPMQWNDRKYAGFSNVKPWFFVNPNYRSINVAAQERDPDSILWFYRKCLELRKREKALLAGSYREYRPLDGKIYMYERNWKNESVLIVCSFSEKRIRYRLPSPWKGRDPKLLLDNYPEGAVLLWLRPYEVQICKSFI